MAPAIATATQGSIEERSAPGTPVANVAPTLAIAVEKPDPSRNIFFPAGETTIPSVGSDTLADIAQELQADRRLTVLLVGHASRTGSKEYCVAVAAKRTSAVTAALLELGVPARQIRRRSLGCEPPSRGDCDSDECRSAESRVELQFVGAEK